MITSSSFRALQGQRVRLYLSILRSLFCFRFFKGCSLFVYSHLFWPSDFDQEHGQFLQERV